MKLFSYLLIPGVKASRPSLSTVSRPVDMTERKEREIWGGREVRERKGDGEREWLTVGKGNHRRKCGDRREGGDGEIKEEFTA